MTKKLLSFVLVVCLLFGMLPSGAVLAESNEKAMQLGTEALNTNVNTTNSAIVYYGLDNAGNPYAYRVIGYGKDNGVKTSVSTDSMATLLALSRYGSSAFSTQSSNAYSSSNLKSVIDGIAGKLTDGEEAAVQSRTLDGIAGALVDNAILWPLSSDEANQVDSSVRQLYPKNPSWAISYWWLRSPGQYNYVARVVSGNGSVGQFDVRSTSSSVRPAFNLKLDSVLFTSAAEGGKPDGGLQAVLAYPGNEWKLTLLDSGRSGFKANAVSGSETSKDFGYTDWKINVTYENAKTEADEYVSALLCDADDNVLYYGNIAKNSESGTAEVTIPTGLAAGNYNLHIFSEEKNEDYKTDYASAFQTINLTVKKVKLQIPTAVFTVSGDDGGMLTDVESGMSYSVDSGNSWNTISGSTVEVTGVNEEKDVLIKRSGDGTSTEDSDVQTIDVTKAAKPSGFSAAACTTLAQNDGKITGVDSTMEYKMASEGVWKSVTGTELTGLSEGTYQVRVKAAGTVFASDVTEVIVDKHTCTAQGDWQWDENNHWKLCACGDKVDEALHSFTDYKYNNDATYFANGTKTAACDEAGCNRRKTVEVEGTKLIDDEAPEGTIKVKENEFKTFLDKITFGIFSLDKFDVTIMAEDTKSGVDTIEYLLSKTAILKNDIKTAEGWKTYSAFSIENEDKSIVYARITDKVGNVTYISSDGLVLDKTAPTVNGIENGKTYCIQVQFTVSETYLDTVKDGTTVLTADDNGVYTLGAGRHTIVVTDKAGNPTEYSVTVNRSHTPEADDGDCTTAVVCQCGTVVTPAKEAHEFTYTSNNDGTHTIGCKNCNYSETESCFGGRATCAEAAICELCKKPYGEPNGHSYVHYDEVTATHNADGTAEHYTCGNCDTLFDKDKKETTKETLVLPMLEHKFSKEWESNETQHWHECECGEKSSVFDHTFEWVTDKDAQVGIAGSKHEECTVCGYKKEAVEILALPAPEYPPVIDNTDSSSVDADNPKPADDTKSPQTGDNTNLWLWYALIIASGGMITIIVYRKKKKQSIK